MNRLLVLESRIQLTENEQQFSKERSIFSEELGKPGKQAWAGKRKRPKIDSDDYKRLEQLILNKMIEFGSDYVNKVSRNSALSLEKRLDINRLGNYSGWLACKDFFFTMMIVAFKELDLPYTFFAKDKSNLFYVSNKNGGSVDHIIRGNKMHIGHLKKYITSAKREDIRKGDVLYYIFPKGPDFFASGHVQLVKSVRKDSNGNTFVTVIEGHRSPKNSKLIEQTGSGLVNGLHQLPEVRELSPDDLKQDAPYLVGKGPSKIRWARLWSDWLINHYETKYSAKKSNYAYRFSPKNDADFVKRMADNNEFYNPVKALIKKY